MKLFEILCENDINLLEATNYNLSNYKSMPRFNDTDMGVKYKLGSKMMIKRPPNEKISNLYRSHHPGEIVTVLGRTLNPSGQHSVVVNPEGTDQVYRIYGYYLQDPSQPLTDPVPRLKKRLTGKIQCGNCGNIFSLDIPGGRHRDHCPACLHSVHIDNRPGDRNAWCGHGTHENWTPSKLVPIGTKISNNVPSIVYKCEKCGAVKVNKYAPDDNQQKISQLPELDVNKVKGRNQLVQ